MKNQEKPITILIAEDDADDRLLLKEAFEENRLANGIYFVNDGEKLIEYLYQRGEFKNAPKPGLVLLDLNMPKKDGREALKEIKADPNLRSIPIVIMTTSKADEDIIRSYDLGVNSFITKPVSFESFVRVVKTVAEYWFQIVQLPPENIGDYSGK